MAHSSTSKASTTAKKTKKSAKLKLAEASDLFDETCDEIKATIKVLKSESKEHGRPATATEHKTSKARD